MRIIFAILLLCGCNSVRQLEKLQKPVTVWAVYSDSLFCVVIVQDSAGKKHSLHFDDELFAIERKYQPGDEIK